MAESIDNIINSFGIGRFNVIIILIVGVSWISDSSELNLVSILGPELRCKWNLSSLQTSFTSVAVFVGQGVGSVYWGYLGDKHGRKFILIVGSLVTVYFGLLSSVAPNYVWYIILRAFVGFGVSSAVFGTCYVAEFIGQKHRGKSLILLDIFYTFGSLYVASIGLWLMQKSGWRMFLVVAAIPSALFLCISYWLPESVQYLQNTGKYDEIVKILDHMSRLNNVQLKTLPQFECVSTSKRGNFKILMSKEYRWKMLIVAILFVSSMGSYYGIVMMNTEFLQMGNLCLKNVTRSMNCHLLNNQDYRQNLVVSTSEMPGLLLVFLLVDRIGRKACLFPGFLLCGIGFICFNLCFIRQNVVMFIMRMISLGLSQIPFLLAAELFPTIVRASALGILTGVYKVGLIGVPFLVQYLLHKSLLTTSIIFAGSCFISAMLVLFLPETKNAALHNM